MIKGYLIPLLVALLLGTSFVARAEEQTSEDQIVWSTEFNGGGSTGEWAPYLLGSNSGGRHAMKSMAGVEGVIYHDFNLSKRFSWTAGADLASGYQASAKYDLYDSETGTWGSRDWHPSRATVYQLWAGVKFRGVMLWAGMRDHHSPLVDDELSAGDMVLSNNARAIPQVEIGFVDFQNIPFTKGWAQIDVALSYGRFTDTRALENRYNYWNDHITKGQLFNYARVYFRSRQDQPLAVTVGVQKGAEFGGTSYFYRHGILVKTIKNGSGLRSYWEMLAPTLRYADGYYEGSQLGSWDFKARYRLKNGINLEGYFQWFWEDGSSMAKRNLTDGLWGVSVSLPGENRVFKKVVAEYIDMRDQSGPIHWAPGDNPGTSITTEATGGDNYYNNSGFNAWQNYGLGLGSSFPKAPLYNSDGFPQFEHNRTRGFQIAALGKISSSFDWKAKFSYAVAWGMGRIPISRALKNTSMLIHTAWNPENRLRGFSLGLDVAFDAGSLRGNNFGALLSLRYNGAFSLAKRPSQKDK